MHKAKGRVLIIAGSDSGGGAGIQGDIKTVTCLGGYAATAITALTAQNTQGVFGIHDVPDDFIRQQITLVLDDIGADAFKTGMLHKISVIEAIADTISKYTSTIPLVLDPVMIAKGGSPLLQPDAIDTLKKRLIPLATVLTPNAPEAEHLSGMKITNYNEMRKAADIILKLGCKSVLIKGAHIDGDTITDMIVGADGSNSMLMNGRINTPHTHGTGCTLASAIATGLAQGLILKDALKRANLYVRSAIAAAPGFGKGHGPIGHNFAFTEK